MKKMFVFLMFISLAMICSCQKQDSGAEAQLAQRKTELDAREEALVQRQKAVEEREKAADQREKAVAEREKAVANSRIIQSRRQGPDAAQAEAERQRRIQQLPPELRALIPDRSQHSANVEKGRITQDPGAQRPDAQRDAQRNQAMPDSIAFPKPRVPEPETTSPSPSPTPE
jgi:hypothetical protein